MRFIHLGDLHLGKSLLDFDLQEDQEHILREILNTALLKKADAVLISGDVYDKAVPSEWAVSLFDGFLRRLSESGLKTYIISGNHDSDERLNYGSALFEANNIFISAKYEGTLAKKTFDDEFGRVNIYMLPFVKASFVRHFHPESEINSYDDAVKAVIENAGINPDERNIILSHQFVAGGEQDPILSGSEGLSVTNVGTLEKISSGSFDAFDYAALGHIHSAQAVGRETVRYSGSPLKYSLSELNYKKTLPFVSLGEKGDVSVELIPLKPLRDLRHIKGELRTLLSPENVCNTEDFIYVTLTDEDMPGDAMNIVRTVYPNAVRLDYENSRTKELTELYAEPEGAERPFEDVIKEFYLKMFGCEISGEELELMLSAAEEAGVTDEAD
ncbi:MAG: exonuclease SbcCD subunit D [Oscillospiraceae bacterium]|nr:exonuclease SbcCD subunit D [Oscillospiraceae bacterium]